MRKTMVCLLLAVLAVAGYSVRATIAQESQQKTMKAPKQGRWHGVIIRWDKDTSTLTVRKGNNDRQIHYDSSTKWTQGTAAAEMSAFKEGSDVICIGTFDEKGRFMANRIDLQPR
ncbi:MAG TPA: hypothetical protein VKM93_06910 [Terriglobia bacterium]|nr:hypothetical protein [Terriglobia bacterium]